MWELVTLGVAAALVLVTLMINLLSDTRVESKLSVASETCNRGDDRMIKKVLSLALLLMSAGIAAAQMKSSQTQTQTPTSAPVKTTPIVPHTNLKVGDKAPEFTLRATDGKTYKLSDFKGQKNVVLAIYVLAFTGG